MRRFKKLPLISDPRAPLCQLEGRIPWDQVLSALSPFFPESKKAPKQAIRLMASFLILENLYKLSDQEVLDKWLRDPFFQYFTGKRDFRWSLPIEASDLAVFREHLGERGLKKLFEFIPPNPLRGASRKIPKQLASRPGGSRLPVKRIGAVQDASGLSLTKQYLEKPKKAKAPTPAAIYRELTRSSSWCKRVHCRLETGTLPAIARGPREEAWASSKQQALETPILRHDIHQELASDEETQEPSPFTAFVKKL